MLFPVPQYEEFQFEGKTVHYLRRGRGEPIILIHGLSGSAHWWRHNIAALARTHEVFTVELVGYGHARHQRSVSVRDNAEVLAAWMRALDLQGATIIGHSLGGHVATRLVSLVPERVTFLVLVCATGLLRGHPVRMALRLPRAGVSGRLSFLPRIMLDSARAGLPNLWRSGLSLLGDDVSELLPLMQVKTLVVWGSRDQLVPPQLGRGLAQAIPGATYREIRGAGHVAMVDRPDEFNRLVLDFLKQPAEHREQAQ